MEIGLIVVLIGVVVYMIGALWFLIVGFSESVLWGLAILFLNGIASLIFAASHWDKAKGPVGLCVGGIIIMVGGFALGGLSEAGAQTPDMAPVSIDASAEPGMESDPEPIDYQPAATSNGDRKSYLQPSGLSGGSSDSTGSSTQAAPAPAPAPAPPKSTGPPPRKNPYASGDTY